MSNVRIKPNLFRAVSKIAEKQRTTENELINDFILKGISEIEDEIDIEVIAEEFGQTKEELIKEIEEAEARLDNGEGIELDVDNLEKRYI